MKALCQVKKIARVKSHQAIEKLLFHVILNEVKDLNPLTHVSHGAYSSNSFIYFPYPSFTMSSLGMNLSAAEFMQ